MSKSLFSSPPVVQQAGPHGFTISIAVNELCTGWIEWGFAPDELDHRSVASHRGLIDASDLCLMIPVAYSDAKGAATPVFYRVAAQPIQYVNAYDISRGTPEHTAVRALRIPHAGLAEVTLGVINDTHAFPDTIDALAQRMDALDPDLLVWNGDVCRQFDEEHNPAAIILSPGATGPEPSDGGWAATRPLLYAPGNHDIRGVRARQLPHILAEGPHPDLPYNTAVRLGPLALITLDAGEDKPDRHPAFAGTAAYEPYREKQADWLVDQLDRPEITGAPFKIVFCHIPLRGLPGQNDGTVLEDHARYSGQGAKLWLPPLIEAGFHAVISGHTHEWRIDKPSPEQPITQVVGGGPVAHAATLTVVRAAPDGLRVQVENLHGQVLGSESWV